VKISQKVLEGATFFDSHCTILVTYIFNVQNCNAVEAQSWR